MCFLSSSGIKMSDKIVTNRMKKSPKTSEMHPHLRTPVNIKTFKLEIMSPPCYMA